MKKDFRYPLDLPAVCFSNSKDRETIIKILHAIEKEPERETVYGALVMRDLQQTFAASGFFTEDIFAYAFKLGRILERKRKKPVLRTSPASPYTRPEMYSLWKSFKDSPNVVSIMSDFADCSQSEAAKIVEEFNTGELL